MGIITLFMFICGSAIALPLGAYLWSLKLISVGTVYLMFRYTDMLSQPLNEIQTQFQDLQQAEACIQRVEELLQAKPALQDDGKTPVPRGALEVELRDVTFGYVADQPGGSASWQAQRGRISSFRIAGQYCSLLMLSLSSKRGESRLRGRWRHCWKRAKRCDICGGSSGRGRLLHPEQCLRFLPIWVIVRTCHPLAEKEIPMSEIEQQSSDEIKLPISPEEASTFHVNRIMLDKAAAAVEADFIMQAYIRAYHAVVPMRTTEEEAEEREWHAIVNKPRVQQALRRMAAEALQEYYAGETEEGGFAVE